MKELLQVQYPVFDFLSTSLIPELGSDITTGSAGNAHFSLILISTVRAFPDQFAGLVFFDLDFSIVSAYFAVVALGIQLCVHDVVVDELHDGEHRRNIILHVRNFYVADGSTRGQLLECRFKFQLAESIDFLGYMDVVAVGDVVLIGNTRNDTKPFL